MKMSRMRGIKIAKDPQLKLRVLRYAGGGGLPRTEQQPAGLIAPLLCRVVLFDPLTRRRQKGSPPDKLEGFLFMPVVGVEPTRVISTRDFESPSSAIPTHRLILFKTER